jgi:hypothetical protein
MTVWKIVGLSTSSIDNFGQEAGHRRGMKMKKHVTRRSRGG